MKKTQDITSITSSAETAMVLSSVQIIPKSTTIWSTKPIKATRSVLGKLSEYMLIKSAGNKINQQI